MNDRIPPTTILLIEENLATRELYERELGQVYPVQAVSIDSSTLHLARQPSVALIILGLDATQQKAWKLLEQICLSASSDCVPIIVYSTSDDRRRALNLKINEYLVQPVLPSLLMKFVSQYVASPAVQPARRLFKFYSKNND
jgi:response regulator RpfG family c-di-GMP phosphodiesterase